MLPSIDPPNMTKFAYAARGFERVMHVAHREWHGIRNATAYSPGRKILIPAEGSLESIPRSPFATRNAVVRIIEDNCINKIVFQGYSDNADILMLYIKAHFGESVNCYMLSHVNTTQFENQYEMAVLSKLFLRQERNYITKIGSVKPGFGKIFPEVWPELILNFAPQLPSDSFPKTEKKKSAYIPLDVGWRKNMYTNVLAGILAQNIDQVKIANYPNGLEGIIDLGKLRIVHYLRGDDLYAQMANSTILLMATLAECQPMTQLEAFAVGTPALSGPLFLDDFSKDPLIELCTASSLDDPARLAKSVERLVSVTVDDSQAIRQMIHNHLNNRHELAVQRYADFLGL